MMQNHICIHGHFYQPPRENPWLEEIETQDSAYPYHDWNARISAECYARNAAARILDDQGYIERITNNYSRMSFNFGPTLLSWLEHHSAGVYAAILEADRLSRERFSGHGSAMAQAYNHIILPLANTIDRRTQILWGIRDFRHRFGRAPEGMWLPEAAVDLETLSIMAEMKLAFTVLSPYQAERIRPIRDDDWHDVSDGSIDPRRPYLQRLPDDRSIVIFFYDGSISRDVAFDGLLNNGESFAGRLLAGFDEKHEEDQLVHIATDGETFGHHHQYGDMALAYALEKLDTDAAAQLTNYGEYLENKPPDWEVEIKENTAWSCSHGVRRWKSDCGCNSGRHSDWKQSWREPLRNALDWLRDALSEIYRDNAGRLFTDPWQARDDYIAVVLDRSPENIDRFMGCHLTASAGEAGRRVLALKLLEMQRQAMLMYTSCGWFFDELSGLETVQVIQYAGRAVQLAAEFTATDIEQPFLERLALAKSNIVKYKDGRHIYEKWVKPASVDLKKAAAHYAISSFFEDYPAAVSIYCYSFENLDNRSAGAGRAKIAVGRTRITSQITGEAGCFDYVVVHLGDHNISCGIGRFEGDAYVKMADDVLDTFEKSDMTRLFQSLAKYFPRGSLYSLTSLFRDEQRKVLDTILETTTEDALAMYRQLYENQIFLLRFINSSSSRIPKSLYMPAEIVVNSDLNRELRRNKLDFETIRGLIEDAERAGIELDTETLEFTLRLNLERLALDLKETPGEAGLLERLTKGVDLAAELPFTVNFREIQTIHHQLKEASYPDFRAKADIGDAIARKWVELFLRLAETLKIRVE